MLWVFLTAFGACAIVYARLTRFAPALAVTCLCGFSTAPINIAFDSLILHVTRREFIGRVMAVIVPALKLASIASTALAGLLASTLLRSFHAKLLGITFGPIDTIFSVTGVLGILSGLYAMMNLRGVHLAGERGHVAAPMGTPAGLDGDFSEE